MRRLFPVSPAAGLLVLLLLGSAFAAPRGVQDEARFTPVPSYDIVVPAFSDAEIASLLRVFDGRLSDPSRTKSEDVVWDFTRRVQAGRLSAAQESVITAHLDTWAGRRPASAALFQAAGRIVRDFTVGNVAPDIAGRDLAGAPLRLSEHRGKVVVLTFSGEWCGICRTEYPYERLMLELYRNWPFALLGVDSAESPAAAREARERHGLAFPAWWDGPGDGPDSGPIATAWLVSGWPTTYVLDGGGVIRFVDLRRENLLKAVRQLLDEHIEAAPNPKTNR